MLYKDIPNNVSARVPGPTGVTGAGVLTNGGMQESTEKTYEIWVDGKPGTKYEQKSELDADLKKLKAKFPDKKIEVKTKPLIEHYSWPQKKALNPRDNYIIYNSKTGKDVESQDTSGRAQHACDVLNDHEKRNGRELVYKIKDKREVTEPGQGGMLEGPDGIPESYNNGGKKYDEIAEYKKKSVDELTALIKWWQDIINKHPNQEKMANDQIAKLRMVRAEKIGAKKTVGEGKKVDRMVKQVKDSEKKLGKSNKEAEDIAWATANKRGMLDNKNKKKIKESFDLEETVNPITHVYPDTRKGVIAFLHKECGESDFMQILDLDTADIYPDPVVHGVWGIDSANKKIRVIVYLAGYKDPHGNEREYNDFESMVDPDYDVDEGINLEEDAVSEEQLLAKTSKKNLDISKKPSDKEIQSKDEMKKKAQDAFKKATEKADDKEPLDEVSSDLLGRYIKLAGADANTSEKEGIKHSLNGDVPGGNKHLQHAHKRFHGVVQATKKQQFK